MNEKMPELSATISNMHYKHLVTEAKCPICGEIGSSDHGSGFVGDLKDTASYWCEEHGEFDVKTDWGNMITDFIARHFIARWL